ncbi:patatin-like phospholipase family protein [Vibrio sp. TRT 21S02]|uniref:patatin-like phospholipase family protein n=1 Tax=unclassified Vibrio TaxID=2614977 RepID=UPI00349F73DF
MPNSGIISNAATLVDVTRLSKYTGGKNTLVAQGGGQRGIFTSGVLDAFLLSNFDPFHEFYGTSAGALNVCAFLCRQQGIGRAFIKDLTTDPDFFSLFGYIRRKQFLGLDWALDKICHYPYQLDIDMGQLALGERRAFAAVTDTTTLADHYLPMLNEDWYKVLIATCAIPRLYDKQVELAGNWYVDGGVSASIPVQEAWRKNARCIIVIRTEGEDLETSHKNIAVETKEVEWFEESFQLIHQQFQSKLAEWKSDWNEFFTQQIIRSKEQKKDQLHLESLNGGRWLFGADDIYRLSHLLGDKFDSGLADMLMVHYQTYSLTQEFLENPPDDCFVVQIKPSSPLKSSSLLSEQEDLEHDYQLGLEAGFRFVDVFSQCHHSSFVIKQPIRTVNAN